MRKLANLFHLIENELTIQNKVGKGKRDAIVLFFIYAKCIKTRTPVASKIFTFLLTFFLIFNDFRIVYRVSCQQWTEVSKYYTTQCPIIYDVKILENHQLCSVFFGK